MGTVTFLTDQSRFGALGHGIHDVDTSVLMSIAEGNVYRTSIRDITKGQSGSPGSMEGMIIYNNYNILGTIDKNTEAGIYGKIDKIDELFTEQTAIRTAKKEEIITGVLPFGARLPSARRLSKHLDVSRNTVDTAYAQLCAEGYIESKPKRGFFVCQVEELAELHIPVKIEEEEEEIRPEKIPYDFSSAGVDMEQFPYHIWRKLLKEIMINDNSELFQKGNFQGDLELRKAIMYYLRQSRGVHVHASQIVVAAGMENLPVSYTHLTLPTT